MSSFVLIHQKRGLVSTRSRFVQRLNRFRKPKIVLKSDPFVTLPFPWLSIPLAAIRFNWPYHCSASTQVCQVVNKACGCCRHAFCIPKQNTVASSFTDMGLQRRSLSMSRFGNSVKTYEIRVCECTKRIYTFLVVILMFCFNCCVPCCFYSFVMYVQSISKVADQFLNQK